MSPLLREDDDVDTRGDEEERGRFELILTAETLYTPPICSYVIVPRVQASTAVAIQS